jgi:hypothetical protein
MIGFLRRWMGRGERRSLHPGDPALVGWFGSAEAASGVVVTADSAMRTTAVFACVQFWRDRSRRCRSSFTGAYPLVCLRSTACEKLWASRSRRSLMARAFLPQRRETGSHPEASRPSEPGINDSLEGVLEPKLCRRGKCSPDRGAGRRNGRFHSWDDGRASAVSRDAQIPTERDRRDVRGSSSQDWGFGAATFSNIEHQAIEVVTDTIRPWAVAWEQALTRDLFTEEVRRTHMLAFNLDGLLRGDIESRYRALCHGPAVGMALCQ